MNNLAERIKKFIEAFEQVFDKDWDYTKEMLGIYDYPETNIENDENVTYIITPNGTFLNPKVDDEIENCGNRGFLLEEYQKLKELL